MSFFIDHPDDWIGVPEYWPFPTPRGATLDSPEQWANALADDLTVSEHLSSEARGRVVELMVMAAQRGAAAGSRAFVTFEDWTGPAYVVESRTQPRTELGTQSLESLVGYDDPNQLGPAFQEDFVTASGLDGKRGYRYLPYDDKGIIYARADYAFEHADEVIMLSGGEVDLVFFERLKPALADLARTVRWSDS